jgi:hypothetical protein
MSDCECCDPFDVIHARTAGFDFIEALMRLPEPEAQAVLAHFLQALQDHLLGWSLQAPVYQANQTFRGAMTHYEDTGEDTGK